jgi:hypothetical protein
MSGAMSSSWTLMPSRQRRSKGRKALLAPFFQSTISRTVWPAENSNAIDCYKQFSITLLTAAQWADPRAEHTICAWNFEGVCEASDSLRASELLLLNQLEVHLSNFCIV